MNVSGITNDRLKSLSFVQVDDEQRAYVNQQGLREIAANDAIVIRLRAARDEACRDALKNLGRYKFFMFGYFAARWVTLNAILGDKRPNPFRELVITAKAMQWGVDERPSSVEGKDVPL